MADTVSLPAGFEVLEPFVARWSIDGAANRSRAGCAMGLFTPSRRSTRAHILSPTRGPDRPHPGRAVDIRGRGP